MSTKEAKPAAPPKGVIPPSAPSGRSGFLSDVIVELGFAEREAVEQAVRAARSPGTTVARVLVESGAISEEQLAHATAERYGIAYIDLGSFAVEAGAANLIKPSAARRYQAVPVGFVGGGLLVAMADPADALGVNDIAVMTKMDVKPAVASRPALDALLEALPLIEDFDDGDTGHGAAAEDPARDYSATEEPAAPASSAVFWQADASGGNGVRETLPDDAEPEPSADAAGAGEEEAARLRAEVEQLRERLAAAEAAPGEGGSDDEGGSDEELRGLRERLTASSAELDQANARARDAERAAEEAGALQEELASVKKELKRARADVDVRTEEMDSLRERLTRAETELVRARAGAEEAGALRERLAALEAELADARTAAEEAEGGRAGAQRRIQELEAAQADADRRIEELEDADRRAEHARQALAEMREETERQREQQLIEERELRGQLEEAESRRGELEERLAEVESSAFAAERAFEELRGAQQRMRGALRALAGPEPESDADSDSDTDAD